MRKRIIPSADEANPTSDDKWLDLEELVEVEVTSEDPEYPIESALLPGGTSGWRASGPGEQTIRLLSHNRKPCAGSSWSSSNLPLSAHKSSSCAGLWTGGPSTTSCGSNGTSTPRRHRADRGPPSRTQRRHHDRADHRPRHQRRQRAGITGHLASSLTDRWPELLHASLRHEYIGGRKS